MLVVQLRLVVFGTGLHIPPGGFDPTKVTLVTLGSLVSVKLVDPGAVPLLVTVMVYVTVWPGFAVVGSAVLEMVNVGDAVTHSVKLACKPLAKVAVLGTGNSPGGHPPVAPPPPNVVGILAV